MLAGAPVALLAFALAALTFSSAFAAPKAPPASAIRPQLPERSQSDRDDNGVADRIDEKLRRLRDKLEVTSKARRRERLTRRIDEPVAIELVFREQVTQAQLDRFEAMGGKFDHVFQAVSYGWTGQLSASRVEELAAAMGEDLIVVADDQPVHLHLDEATRTGRVRPVWTEGFAGSDSGFSGASDTTIAIVDSGVDDSHPDLAGRLEYWKDFSGDHEPSPVDFEGHGTHVAGIALGSGSAFGVGPGTLAYSFPGDAVGLEPGSAYVSFIHLPPAELTMSARAVWTGGGGSVLVLVSRENAASGSLTRLAHSGIGHSPLSLSAQVSGDPAKQYTFALPQNDAMSIERYAISAEVTPYPAVGDGFPAFRGVAPGVKWAGVKIFSKSGASSVSIISKAFDDLVVQRQAHNIKVINASFGANGAVPELRAKVNTLVQHGVVVVCSAGNSGPGNGPFNLIGDPARAALVLTVGSSNDANQLVNYTSSGFFPPLLDEDIKPDILAPGGSVYQSYVLSTDSNDGDGTEFDDQVADDYLGNQGTSMASPFVAGAAALVIEAMESTGTTWDFEGADQPLFVKMILLAAATETNAKRDFDYNNPVLGRAAAPKDLSEGYGILSVDASIEALLLPYAGGELAGTTHGGAFDRRSWGRRVALPAGPPLRLDLTVPATADYDFYLYNGEPDERGNPVILSSSTAAGLDTDEVIVLPATYATSRYLFVKRIAGHGEWSLSSSVAPVVCGDGVISGEEECDSTSCCSESCEIEKDGTACDDDLFCTTEGTCQSGVCVAGGDPCAGGGECNDFCNEWIDSCADPEGTPCSSDGSVCSDDLCSGGACLHLPSLGGAPCRPSAGVCDLEERCDGVSPSCPADARRPTTTVCRGSVAACDAAEYCAGSSTNCPADAIASADDVCRPAATSCDVAEFCTGTSLECPAQVVAPAGTTCATSDENPCTDDTCNGTSPLCQYTDNTAPCDNGIFCDGADTCSFGACLVHAGDPCPGPDGDGDCSESCSEAAGACVAPDPDTSACEELCGDANSDGEITAADALTALRAATGSAVCTLAICDFTGDGTLAASDALSILRYAVSGQGSGQCGEARP